MVFLWCLYDFLWFSYGFPKVFPMVFLWLSYGFPMVSPWFSYGFPMVSLWFSYGFPMVFFLRFSCVYSQHGNALSSSAHPTLHAAPGPRRDAGAASSPGGELQGANPSYIIVYIYIVV